MKLPIHILTTAGKRLRSATIETDSPSIDRATIHQAERFARQWASDNDHRIESAIVIHGRIPRLGPTPAGSDRQTAAHPRRSRDHFPHDLTAVTTN